MLSPHEITTLILIKDARTRLTWILPILTLSSLEGACRDNLGMMQVLKVIKNSGFM